MKYCDAIVGARVRCCFTSASYMFSQRHERFDKTATIIAVREEDEDYTFNFDVAWDDGLKDHDNWSHLESFELLEDQSPYVEPQVPCKRCSRPTRRAEKACWWCGIEEPQRA